MIDVLLGSLADRVIALLKRREEVDRWCSTRPTSKRTVLRSDPRARSSSHEHPTEPTIDETNYASV